MEYVIQFILFFIIIFLYYYFIATKRFKAKYSDKEKVNLPEVKLLVRMANLDMKKVNYKKLLKQITFMFSIVLPITVLTTFFVKSIFLKILVGFVLLIGLTYLVFILLEFIIRKEEWLKMYNFKKIEKKWQDIWENEKAFVCENNSDKPKYYYLIEFPYPSGAGLHVGHVRSQTALDSMARKKRMQGFNVLYPIGWDSFGLPTEQYAIKNHIHPKIATKQNIETFKRQIKSLGISFDWSREFSTTDEDYYKWTQWQFLKFFEKGMAYKAEKEINWCPNCKIGLSNEESEGNVCERCGGKVEKKLKSQWMLKMSLYADKLLDGLSMTDFVDRVKTAQITG